MATWWDRVSANGNRFVQPGFNAMGNTETTSGGKHFSESYINSVFGQAEVSYRNMVYVTVTGAVMIGSQRYLTKIKQHPTIYFILP
ncbi:MAG: hypothetical protein LIP01_13415 [Tannerellaceae bacterium]|nr:hypothetical protein [Tannerellaceae bacterium]